MKVNMTMKQAFEAAKIDATLFEEDKSVFVALTERVSEVSTTDFNYIIDMTKTKNKQWESFTWFTG